MFDARRTGDGAAIALQRDHANIGKRFPERAARAVCRAVVDDDHLRSLRERHQMLECVRRFSTTVARDHDDGDVMIGVGPWRDER